MFLELGVRFSNWECVYKFGVSFGIRSALVGHRSFFLAFDSSDISYPAQKDLVENSKLGLYLPPFSLLRDFSFQNTFEHFAIRFRQSYLIWEVSDVTAIELSS